MSDVHDRRPRRWPRVVAVVALVVVLAYVVKTTRWHVFPKRLQQLEPGLFRSGQMEPWPYERVVADHAIRTVLRLNVLGEDDPRRADEARVLAAADVELVEIPMFAGDGLVPFEQLERAADVVAEEQRRPLLFHCSAGDRRSGAVQAAYRLKHCGWNLERTLAEVEARGSTDEPLLAHLRRFYEERVAAAR